PAVPGQRYLTVQEGGDLRARGYGGRSIRPPARRIREQKVESVREQAEAGERRGEAPAHAGETIRWRLDLDGELRPRRIEGQASVVDRHDVREPSLDRRSWDPNEDQQRESARLPHGSSLPHRAGYALANRRLRTHDRPRSAETALPSGCPKVGPFGEPVCPPNRKLPPTPTGRDARPCSLDPAAGRRRGCMSS